MSDLALARRLIAREESAFQEFFAEYFPRLYRFARVRLDGNEDAAEEVVQAVLIRAIDKLHTYRGEAALFTWLCTFCRREIAAWCQGAERAREVSWSDVSSSDVSSSESSLIDDRPETRAALDALAVFAGDDPETEVGRLELSRLVQATLDHLPGRYGDVLEWKYIQGLSVDEVAEKLGVGYKAAESLLTRARQAFRDGFSLVAGVEDRVKVRGLRTGGEVRG